MTCNITTLPRMLLLKVMVFLVSQSFIDMYPEHDVLAADHQKQGRHAMAGARLIGDIIALSYTCKEMYHTTNDEVGI